MLWRVLEVETPRSEPAGSSLMSGWKGIGPTAPGRFPRDSPTLGRRGRVQSLPEDCIPSPHASTNTGTTAADLTSAVTSTSTTSSVTTVTVTAIVSVIAVTVVPLPPTPHHHYNPSEPISFTAKIWVSIWYPGSRGK